MTNHLGDIQNSKCVFIIGANPAVAHPVGMVHILRAKELGAKIISVDPHYSRTATKADLYARIRPGTDIAFMYGMIRYIIKNNLHDKEFIKNRVYGFEETIKEAEQYTPEVVEDITGVPANLLIEITETMARAKPATLIYNQGLTQHTVGTGNTRQTAILQLLLGNMGKPGGGCNILRGHDNVQGASDMSNLAHSLPGYYGLSEGAWKYFCKNWKVDYEWMQSRFKTPEMLHKTGYSVSTWRFGVLEDRNAKNNSGTMIRGMMNIGSGLSSIALTNVTKEAMEKLELCVIVDPYVNDMAAIADMKNNLFILPAASQIETSGTVTATNRATQWRSQVIEPMYECKTDHEILFELAKKIGFYDEMVRAMGDGKGNFTWPEDATREYTQAIRSIGLQGVTPERLKAQSENWHMFDTKTLRGKGPFKNEYYGLPWPCWSEQHSGTPILYNIDAPVMEGGMGFRTRWTPTAPNGESLLSEVALEGTKTGLKGHDHITAANIEALTGIKLTDKEKETVQGKTWSTDTSNILVEKALAAGLCPFGNGKARTHVWEWIDKVPKHREPLHSPRPDLISKYPTYQDKENHYRAFIQYESRQNEKVWAKEFPMQLLTGRLVSHLGTGTESRASLYLSEVDPEPRLEIHPDKGFDLGLRDGDMVWIYGTNGLRIKVKSRFSTRVGYDTASMPYTFSGVYQGESILDRYPKGLEPYAVGEGSNTIISYGFDIVTTTPETKCTLCRIEKA
jgi:formate dehydrogenase major subunit